MGDIQDTFYCVHKKFISLNNQCTTYMIVDPILSGSVLYRVGCHGPPVASALGLSDCLGVV